MISQPKNRVQAIKSKFENLNTAEPQKSSLYKIKNDTERKATHENKENSCKNRNNPNTDIDITENSPNRSYLYKNDVKRSASDSKATLCRQISDPGKKLQRSHAFRCERTLASPKRNAFCNRSINMDRKLSKDRLKKLGDFLEEHMKKENFVPPDILSDVGDTSPVNSIPDSEVPPHILAQYAKVIKPKKDDLMTDSGVSSETENLEDDRSRVKKLTSQFEQEREDKFMADKSLIPDKTVYGSIKSINGTERPHEHEKASYGQEKPFNTQDKFQNGLEKAIYESERIVNTSPYEEVIEKPQSVQKSILKLEKSNLSSMEDLAGSSETMKLERKNPHLILTDTLKKALKQPLPPGPPPKKPPRNPPIDLEKSDTKRKLEKLEQLLIKKEANKTIDKSQKLDSFDRNIYDIAEENLSIKRPKEVHYLCTEILDITQRTLLLNNNTTDSPLKNCFGRLNCTKTASISSLPYNRLSTNLESNRNSCSCSTDNLFIEKCQHCRTNDQNIDILNKNCQESFKCHINDNKIDSKCRNCQINDEKGFKCFLKCHCKEKNSEFYVDTHIYDEPFVEIDRKNKYGTLNSVKLNGCSKSLEDLPKIEKEETSIYEIPCDITPPPSPKKTDFQKLLDNFENSSIKAKSTENLDTKYVKRSDRSAERSVAKYATEVKRYKKVEKNEENERNSISLQLNRLMDEMAEVYASAASNMDDNKPGSFPTDLSSDTTSEESAKLNRSLTEKRKNYVRRVSSRLAYLDPTHLKNTRYRHQTSTCSYKSYKNNSENPYTTFRSWKSFRESKYLPKMELNCDKIDGNKRINDNHDHNNKHDYGKHDHDETVSMTDSLDHKTGCVDIECPFERENGLFNVCLLVGLNYMTGQAYVKNVFPSQVKIPQHIENLIFPETFSQDKDDWTTDAKATQCYSFVLTDERGERSYGYCRRVLPEGATTCLPLCYCLIGKYRAPGFYYKVLQEIESHHGSSATETNVILQQLFDIDFPNPGEAITIIYDNINKQFTTNLKHYDQLPNDSSQLPNDSSQLPNDSSQLPNYSNQLPKNSNQLPQNESNTIQNHSSCPQNVDVKILTNFNEPHSGPDSSISDEMKCKTMPELRNMDYYNYFDNNNTRKGTKVKTIQRPLESRSEDTSMCELLDACGPGVLVKMFATLLHERKLVVRAQTLSSLSQCMCGLQCATYPFVWQQPLISCAPHELHRELTYAPLPILSGLLATQKDNLQLPVEEGMFIDLTHPSKILFYQGDETTILPTNCYKTLKTSLQMETLKNAKDDTKTRNVMISEAFLRFFVDILGDFWKFFRLGERQEGDMGKGDVVFDKDNFIKSATSKQNQYFLEWFTETAMFNHFIQNMSCRYYHNILKNPENPEYKLIDAPAPNFYQLFEERVQARLNRSSVDKSGYKMALNKARLLKARLKELVG